ncbi:unnamed protein product [Peronospora destructor]|uniref:PH domain-containing protein n=1 Tax=Peronospora destructor TaxID=86335 RepID=A0AAV0VCE0_9STRA|nr:unnamed protein product [Peronospora destructor]
MATVPEYCGWGTKQGSKVRSWKKRYFILCGRELVYYSGAKTDGTGAGVGKKGCLRVLNVEDSPDRINGLLIHGEGGKTLKMTTASAHESRLLFRKLKEAMEEHEKSFRLSQKRSVAEKMELPLALKEVEHQKIETLDDTELVARKYSTAVCGGWVEKLGQRNKIWKKRYMSWTNGMLEYRKGPTEQLSAELNVTDARYSTEYSGAIEIEFGSEKLLSDSDTICIRTESIRDLNSWMCALCDAVGKPRLPQLPPFPLYQDSDKSRAISSSTQPLTPSDIFDRFSEDQVAAAGDRIKRGWLYEQGSNMSSWMLRYFVFSGNTLHHYKHVNTTSETLGNVASVTRSNESTGSLVVHFDGGSTLNVYGETKADTEAWYAALCKASWNSVENPMKRGSVSKEQEEEELEEDNGFGGWLLKKGQHFKTWKRRYFVLERSRLAYSAAAGSDVLGSGVVFEVNVGDLRPFCLNVRFQNGRLLHVVAPTEEAFSKWFDVLHTASNLVESFLSQGNGKVIIGEEFDNDIVENVNVNDVDVEFTAEDIFEYDMSLHDGEGASLWIAAMQNKPEYDALSSSSSEQYNENVAEAEIVSRASEASSRILSEPQGCVGWLMKEGGNIKSWKLRYFTLYGSTLSYYKSEKGSLLRSVNVVDVAVHPLIFQGLTISTVGGRMLIVQAESNENYNRWLTSIRGAVSGEKDRMTAGVAAPTMNTSMRNGSSVELEGLVSHSGWLLKEGQRFKTWKKRFFTLKNSALIYYSEIGGVARGHGRVKGAHEDDTKPNTLVIKFHSDKTMRVRAASEVEMKSWFQVFSQIHFLRNKTISDVSDDVVDSEGEGDDGESAAPMSRFDPSDYLNDAISNDTLMRLHDEEGKATFLESQNCTASTSRSFKGELTFDEEEEKEDMSLTIIGADYCRRLLAEDERVQEKRLAEKLANAEPPMTECTPCCILM